MQHLTALVVDDEPFARDEMRHLLTNYPMVRPIVEASSSYGALEMLDNQEFDLVFLDINLPDGSGLAVAKALTDSKKMPYVIVVTAYEEFALAAFEAAVRDYLLKPVPPERFGLAMARALDFSYRSQLGLAAPERRFIDVLPVHINPESIRLVPLREIVAIEAERQYCRVHLEAESLLCSTYTLTQLQDLLPSFPFMRVHRSYIVNLGRVTRVETGSGISKYELVMAGDRLDRVPVSRRSFNELKWRLGL